MKKAKKIVAIALVLMCWCYLQLYAQHTLKKTRLENTKFKKGYNYSTFTSNDDYLAWAEFYTRQIFIYNLKAQEIDTVIQKTGRGPHEYEMISALSLTDDNKLLITDPENIKLITYNIQAGQYLEDLKLDQARIYRTTFQNNFLFCTSISSQPRYLYYILDLTRRKISAIKAGDFDISEEFSYPFKAEGYVTSNSKYGVHLARYYPYIYVISLQDRRIQNKIVFDDKVKIKRGKTTTMKGNKAFLAPENVDVLNKDIAFLPDSEESIIILAEGRSKQRTYSLNKLRVYNFKKSRFTKKLDVGVKATRITSNKEYLFVYSEDENNIYQYKMNSTN